MTFARARQAAIIAQKTVPEAIPGLYDIDGTPQPIAILREGLRLMNVMLENGDIVSVQSRYVHFVLACCSKGCSMTHHDRLHWNGLCGHTDSATYTSKVVRLDRSQFDNWCWEDDHDPLSGGPAAHSWAVVLKGFKGHIGTENLGSRESYIVHIEGHSWLAFEACDSRGEAAQALPKGEDRGWDKAQKRRYLDLELLR